MKRLYLVAGPMGVGKSAVCRILKNSADRAVMLDGDWCWDMHPFTVTDETKEMVQGNIAHLLGSFLRCSEIENIFFCWVMQDAAIADALLARLELADCEVRRVALTCSPEALEARVKGDIEAGVRAPESLARALAYLPLYKARPAAERLDTTGLSPQQVAARILAL